MVRAETQHPMTTMPDTHQAALEEIARLRDENQALRQRLDRIAKEAMPDGPSLGGQSWNPRPRTLDQVAKEAAAPYLASEPDPAGPHGFDAMNEGQ